MTPRLQEQFGYAYDKAWNLTQRPNNALIKSFSVNNVNEITGAGLSGTYTVAGSALEKTFSGGVQAVSSVTVNGQNANLYGDSSFAAPGFSLATGNNTFTAIAQDGNNRSSTNTVTTYVNTSPSYSYDSNGNLLGDGPRNFAYDDENELISVCVSNAWSNSFAYDGKMRRRIERDYAYLPSSNSYLLTNEVHFIYDGNVVVEERNANNNSLVSYTRGNDLLAAPELSVGGSGTQQGAGGIGGLLARTTYGQEIPGAPTTAFYHADGNGNITSLMYPSQQLAAKYIYDSFGNLLGMSGPLAAANVYRFSSKEWNANAGLYYYGYRFYDPNLQRWPNQDPLGEKGFETLRNAREKAAVRQDGVPNLYDFVENDPIARTDFVGLTDWQLLWDELKLATPYVGESADIVQLFGGCSGLGLAIAWAETQYNNCLEDALSGPPSQDAAAEQKCNSTWKPKLNLMQNAYNCQCKGK